MQPGPASIHQSVYHSRHHPHLDVRTTLDSIQPYATHVHDCLSLGIVTAGKTRLSFARGECVLHAGEGVLIASELAHSCNPVDNTPRSYHMFYTDKTWACRMLGIAEHAAIHVHTPFIRGTSIINTLIRLAEAIALGQGVPEADAELSHLIADRSSGIMPPDRIWADCPEGVSIADAAREAGMGREGFIRHAKREIGMTPGAYRQCLRLARARKLLHHGTDLAITALESGFADQSHLHRMCVKHFAATPKQLKPR